MVLAAARGLRGEVTVQHELEVVLAVRQLEVHPVEALAVAASPPRFPEAEEIAIESERLGQAADQDARMAHGRRDAVGAQARGARSRAGRGVLDELDDVAVGVLHAEGGPAAARGHGGWHAHAAGAQVDTESLGVVRLERDVVETIGSGAALGNDLDDLPVVDREAGRTNATVRGGDRRDLGVAEEVAVVRASPLDVVYEERDVGQARDAGPLGRGGWRDGRGDHEGRQQQSHGVSRFGVSPRG